MKLPTVVAFSTFVLTALACAGAGGVPLTEPWTGLDLPVDGGNVLHSDESTFTIQYSGNQVKTLGPKYRDAFEKAGWEQVAEVENSGNYTISYKHDGKTVGVGISSAAGDTIAGGSMR